MAAKEEEEREKAICPALYRKYRGGSMREWGKTRGEPDGFSILWVSDREHIGASGEDFLSVWHTLLRLGQGEINPDDMEKKSMGRKLFLISPSLLAISLILFNSPRWWGLDILVGSPAYCKEKKCIHSEECRQLAGFPRLQDRDTLLGNILVSIFFTYFSISISITIRYIVQRASDSFDFWLLPKTFPYSKICAVAAIPVRFFPELLSHEFWMRPRGFASQAQFKK